MRQPNPNGKKRRKRVSSGPLCTFAEADPLYRAFEKREGKNSPKEAGSRNEGGGKLPLDECKQLLSFTAYPVK